MVIDDSGNQAIDRRRRVSAIPPTAFRSDHELAESSLGERPPKHIQAGLQHYHSWKRASTIGITHSFCFCCVQILESLKPDGAFVGAVLGGDSLQELRYVVLPPPPSRSPCLYSLHPTGCTFPFSLESSHPSGAHLSSRIKSVKEAFRLTSLRL